jgi:exodeoxyribonuclease-5
MTLFDFTDGQEQAISNLLEFLRTPGYGVRVLKGYAGTGKTTAIQEVIKERLDLRWGITAPTHKATKVLKRMADVRKLTEHIQECRTIHSLLGLRLQANGAVKELKARGGLYEPDIKGIDVVVVDEASMVNEQLFYLILQKAREYGVKVVLMLDPLQLPPVGEDASLACASDIPHDELTEVVRQAGGNPIIELTERIRHHIVHGGMPEFFTAKSEHGGVYVLDKIKFEHWMKVGFNSDRYRDVDDSYKAIAWRNATVSVLNRKVRQVLYPDQWQEKFVIGERVLSAEPVFDGPDGDILITTDEQGVIDTLQVAPHPMYKQFTCYHLGIVKENGDTATAYVTHPDSLSVFNRELDRRQGDARKNSRMWGSFWQFKEMFADIRPCHAITAHRSQGSTYENVFLDVGDIMVNRNWTEALKCLYVGASRASQNLMILR